MRQSCYLLLATIVFSVAGCEQGAPSGPVNTGVGTQPNQVVPPPSVSPPATGATTTGVWSQSQVETYLVENLKLSVVNLQSTGGDHYTGLGQGADGATYDLRVKQVPGGIKCEYKTDRGGSGTIAFGNPVP